MVNDVGKAIDAFVTMLETRQIVQPKNLLPQIQKEPNTANINTNEAARNPKIGVPLVVYFCNCENKPPFGRHHQF